MTGAGFSGNFPAYVHGFSQRRCADSAHHLDRRAARLRDVHDDFCERPCGCAGKNRPQLDGSFQRPPQTRKRDDFRGFGFSGISFPRRNVHPFRTRLTIEQRHSALENNPSRHNAHARAAGAGHFDGQRRKRRAGIVVGDHASVRAYYFAFCDISPRGVQKPDTAEVFWKIFNMLPRVRLDSPE